MIGRKVMVLADKRDYQRGYKKHYSAYKELCGEVTVVKSRRLLLAYCVECGLKYLLLDKWHENNPKKIIEDKEDRRNGIIKTHNLDKILKELGQAGTFKFPQLETKHYDIVATESFHELCRYGIEVKAGEEAKENKFEEELLKVAKWIGEEL